MTVLRSRNAYSDYSTLENAKKFIISNLQKNFQERLIVCSTANGSIYRTIFVWHGSAEAAYSYAPQTASTWPFWATLHTSVTVCRPSRPNAVVSDIANASCCWTLALGLIKQSVSSRTRQKACVRVTATADSAAIAFSLKRFDGSGRRLGDTVLC